MFQSALNRLGGPVAGAGTPEVDHYVLRSLLQRPAQDDEPYTLDSEEPHHGRTLPYNLRLEQNDTSGADLARQLHMMTTR